MDLVNIFAAFTIFESVIQCLPANDGFGMNTKSKSINENEILKGVIITSPSLQGKLPDRRIRQNYNAKIYFPKFNGLDPVCTNELQKILFSTKHKDTDMEKGYLWGDVKYIKLPIVKQPFDNYKIVIATAPPNININGDSNPIVIYVIFSEETANNSSLVNIPSIYFVKNLKQKMDEKDRVDPILIIDSNRTVTGLKSKEIAKYLKFKNKLTKLPIG